jgi:hypothetical protein
LLPFLHQTATSAQVAHREVGVFILFTVLETIVEGFQEHLSSFFKLFETLLADPDSIEVRITTVRYMSPLSHVYFHFNTFHRALGVIAQYIDADDKKDVVSLLSHYNESIFDLDTRNHSKLYFPPSSMSLGRPSKQATRLARVSYLMSLKRSSFLSVDIPLSLFFKNQFQIFRRFLCLVNTFLSLPSSFWNVVGIIQLTTPFEFLRSMHSIGPFNSESACLP